MNIKASLAILAGLSVASIITYWPDDKAPDQQEPQAAKSVQETMTMSAGADHSNPKKEGVFTEPSYEASASLVADQPPKPNQNEISYQGDVLSLNIEGRPLKEVLAEISAKSGVAINVMAGSGDENVSMSFSNLSIEQALKALLGSYDTFYLHSPSNEIQGELRAAWVFPKGQGSQVKPLPPEQWASTTEFSMNLMDGDPNVRGTAVEGLISRQGSASLENVLATLKDNDDSVRFRTLYKASYAGIQIPDDTLLSLVREDGSPDVRGMALKILADRPNIGKQHLTEIARNSLGDTDPTVRDVAEEVLSQLSTPVDSIEYGE